MPLLTLHFNHDSVAEEARDKWERRKKRINRDNLYVIMYNLDGVTVEEIKQLENFKCNNKIVLSCKELPEISWSLYIKPVMKYKYPYGYIGKDFLGIMHYEKKFDFIGFLNKK